MKSKNIFLLLLFPVFIFSQGFSDWTSRTPKGNEINNFNGKSLIFKDGKTLEGLWEWYFYKDHIVGILADSFADEIKFSYYIVNEKTEIIQKFNSEKEWNSAVERQKLKPKFWKRWYQGDWKFFDDSSIGMVLFAFILLVPLYLLLLFFEKFVIKKNSKFSNLAIVLTADLLIIFLIWLSDNFPQSF